MAYAAVTVEGGLFPADLLERVAEGSGERQRSEDFGLGGGQRLSDEMQGAFSDMRAYWDTFQRRLAHSRESATSITRDAWIIPLLERLGFDLTFQRSAAVVGGESYAISHRAGDDPDAPPVHIEAEGRALDRRDGARRSPHALVQEYLNRTDALWGIATNGERLRLLRDSARLSRPTYLEFDLRALVEGNLYSEFVLLYRLLHRSRFPQGGADAHECMLERTYQQGIDEGGRVREHLRDGVEEALRTLGTAFLIHPESEELRQALRDGRLDAAGYYRQLLRLVYRLLFLMVVEERKLVFPPGAEQTDRQAVYTRCYSITQLRDRCERPFADPPKAGHADLWQGLLQTFRLFRDADAATQLGLMALDGELFGPEGCPDLERAGCDNARLLRAMYRLSTFEDTGERTGGGRARRAGVRRRVNYAALDVEELGSVYESLLEYHPQVTRDPTPAFDLVFGSERKSTGSYYTPPDLVHELIQSALVPVVEDRLKAAKTKEDKERALLGLRVCDPASGSGHFLLAAARRIARELAKVRSGEAEPSPEAYRAALRDVIRHCVYAVDKNPLAVDLCKVALWLEGHNAGLPLSFLDHHAKCGDSLVGVYDLDVLTQGIPDEAYTPVTGDDKATASAVKRQNKVEREGAAPTRGAKTLAGQHSFEGLSAIDVSGAPRNFAREFEALAEQEERTPGDVQAKEALYEDLRRRGGRWWTHKVACDLWTAAFFMPLRPVNGARGHLVPTTDAVRRFLTSPNAVHGQVTDEALALAQRLRFFHWPLEFPEVFAAGGFDVVLGNPPWEQLQPEEVKFFAAHDRAIAALAGAQRKAVIERLPKSNPRLAGLWEEFKRDIEATSTFIRGSLRVLLTAVGKINTYSIFAETMRTLLGPSGRAGVIVPSGIATDDTTKLFFADLMQRRSLVSLFDFENQGIFPAVDSRYKFCLLTLTGTRRPAERGAEFAFFLHATDELRDPERRFVLTAEDMALLNPNTRTCPIFRSRRDAELTRAIYRRVPVLVREGPPEENPWGVQLRQGLFNMTSDSKLFWDRGQLDGEGWRLEGNIFARGGERYLPLYEAKLLHQFDHRWATYDGLDTRDLTDAEKADPRCVVLPRYWVPEREVQARLVEANGRRWLLSSRMMARSTDERALIATLLPWCGVGNSAAVWSIHSIGQTDEAGMLPCLLANLSSFVMDFVVRQKVGGANLNFFYTKQFPVLPPAKYNLGCPWIERGQARSFILPRVLELTYTAWDLAPFAHDLGYDAPPFRWDEERRFLLRCELDAAFFHLYGIARADVDYIMDTFPIVRRRDEQAHGEYRTKRVILEMYDEMARAMAGGPPYRTRLDPPPADRAMAHRATSEVMTST